MIKHSFISFAIVASTFLTQPSFAQKSGPNTHGSIEIQEEAKIEYSYAKTQDEALAFVTGVYNRALALGQGKTAPASVELSQTAAHYLTTVYLYCSVRAGTCPSILNLILENDLINSQISKKPECPAMLKFWSTWIAGDMEKRHQFLVKMSFMNATTDFKTRSRPRYIHCQDTMKQEISTGTPDVAFFKARYAADSENLSAIKRAVAIVDEVRTKERASTEDSVHPFNVFRELGILPPGAKSAPEAPSPTAPKGQTPSGGRR